MIVVATAMLWIAFYLNGLFLCTTLVVFVNMKLQRPPSSELQEDAYSAVLNYVEFVVISLFAWAIHYVPKLLDENGNVFYILPIF